MTENERTEAREIQALQTPPLFGEDMVLITEGEVILSEEKGEGREVLS